MRVGTSINSVQISAKVLPSKDHTPKQINPKANTENKRPSKDTKKKQKPQKKKKPPPQKKKTQATQHKQTTKKKKRTKSK